MVAGIQVLVPRAEKHVRSLAQHVARLQAEGLSVLLVTANRPFDGIRARLQEAGVDVDALMVLDAISSVNGFQPTHAPRNVVFLQSPTMLEMIAMRTEQIVGRQQAPVHVVVDSLNALALYNGVEPVQEFSHYLANRLRSRGATGDFMILDNQQGRDLEHRVAAFTDGRAEMELA